MDERFDKILKFCNELDRKLFIDNENKQFAHLDCALPIECGQTISQPSLVCEMTRQLDLNKNVTILELGTGSGYQTAYLAKFGEKVYTVELIEELSIKAQNRLNKLGFKNIEYKIGDGSDGWSENAPFDRIIMTAAVSKHPDTLVQQLKPGGRMIFPIGMRKLQDLVMIIKDNTGHIKEKILESVVFIEFKGKYGFDK